MSLRRTALTRRTELRRTPMPRGKRATRDRAVRTIARQRDTGPTAAVRRLVAERADWSCEVCGQLLWTPELGWVTPHSYHHRRPRAMGGSATADTNSPANLLLLCGTADTGCHGWIEGNRTRALARGWLVLQGQDPSAIRVTFPSLQGPHLVLLDHDGTYVEVSP